MLINSIHDCHPDPAADGRQERDLTSMYANDAVHQRRVPRTEHKVH